MRIIKDNETPSDCPDGVPWVIVQQHDKQAVKNHGQTLKELNDRGGVSARELYAILTDHDFIWDITEQECVDFINVTILRKM